MPAESEPIDLRRVRFGRAVVRAVSDARDRGMTIEMIEKATDVSWTTIDRWMKGSWNKDPRGTQVKALFEGLGASVDDAYAALGWSANPERAEPEPAMDPRLRKLARILADPNVSVLEKIAIQAQLDFMLQGKLARGEDKES